MNKRILTSLFYLALAGALPFLLGSCQSLDLNASASTKKPKSRHVGSGRTNPIVLRQATKSNTRVVVVKLHIPKFILPCANGVEQYIFEIVQYAYGYNLLLTPEFIINLTARSRFIGESFVFESLQQSINNLIKYKKLYCNTVLLPKILHDAYQKDNCITISSLNKQYSNLNKNQTYFLDWINRTCGFYLYESLYQDQDSLIKLITLYHPNSTKQTNSGATL